MNRKVILGILIAVIVIVIGYTIYNHSGQKVEAVTVLKGSLNESIEETGYIQSSKEYEVQALESGRILQISTDRGQSVSSGQVLVTMQSIDMDIQLASLNERVAVTQTQLDSARMNYKTNCLSLNQAKVDLNRKKTLLDAGGISRAEYENTAKSTETLEQSCTAQQNIVQGFQRQLDSLELQRQEMGEKSQQLNIQSPMDGVLLLLNAKEGQLVSQGNVLAKVGTAGGLAVKTDILCDAMANVTIGQSVEVTSPVLDNKPVPGKITEIYPQAHEEVSSLGVAQRRVTVIATLEKNELLKPGYEVQVNIKTAEAKDVLLLTRESVLVGNGPQGEVSMIIKGRIVKQKVQTGLKSQKYVEIVSGLGLGDTVVRDASLQLKAGRRVKIMSDN